MANHCENDITITDFADPEKEKKLIKRLKKAEKNEENLLNIVTTIKKLKKEWETGILGIANIYGTKWIIINAIEDIDDDRIEICATSAWSPATGWAKILSKKYECTVRIKYDEPGCAFMGVYEATNGVEQRDECIEY